MTMKFRSPLKRILTGHVHVRLPLNVSKAWLVKNIYWIFLGFIFWFIFPAVSHISSGMNEYNHPASYAFSPKQSAVSFYSVLTFACIY